MEVFNAITPVAGPRAGEGVPSTPFLVGAFTPPFFLGIEFLKTPRSFEPLSFSLFFIGDPCCDLELSSFGGNSPVTLRRLLVAVGVL